MVGTDADADAPAGGRVAGRDGGNHVHQRRRAGRQTAEGSGRHQSGQSRRDERVDDRLGQVSLLFALIGVLGGDRTELLRSVERVGGGRGLIGAVLDSLAMAEVIEAVLLETGLLARLRGVLKGTDGDESDYRRHLERKYR
jgi:hypothetical protein